jgi:hypothetical protein
MKRLVASLVLCLAAAAAWPSAAAAQQQMADTTFRPTVAKPAFTDRHPRVLIDEAHYNFHTLNGRYKPFADLLRADGCRLEANRDALRAARLAGCDLLVIANALGDDPEKGADAAIASSAFTTQEIEAVHDWVEGGGSLLLIADHAPFGAAAAALGARFGVEMSQGWAVDSLQADGSTTTIAFTRQRGSLGKHPMMEGPNQSERIGRLIAFTGQSLKGSDGSTPFMMLSDGAFDLPPDAMSLRADPEAMLAKAVPAKGRSMGVAMSVGKGRVVVMGEAGMLSAQVVRFEGREPMKFGMNRPGTDNQQFALNMVRWLAGKY